MTKSIMIVGVGGQGTLLTSRILGALLCGSGCDVKLSEVHGMSQRGGSVITYVKYGDRVASPIIAPGEADLILAFELLEAARALPYLKKGGRIIANNQEIMPMPVITGAADYPADIAARVQALGADLVTVDALPLALEAGNAKAVNVVLLGVLSRSLSFTEEAWRNAIESTVPPKFLEANWKAFLLGRGK
ncbi:MAG: indolepyruvate oxidoreductase subunit beta [Oscillospiraceae bacterium]|nr:indolepyruvate oxidoreductase subunit beta [Oscillospiraceae bacterium]